MDEHSIFEGCVRHIPPWVDLHTRVHILAILSSWGEAITFYLSIGQIRCRKMPSVGRQVPSPQIASDSGSCVWFTTTSLSDLPGFRHLQHSVIVAHHTDETLYPSLLTLLCLLSAAHSTLLTYSTHSTCPPKTHKFPFTNEAAAPRVPSGRKKPALPQLDSSNLLHTCHNS